MASWCPETPLEEEIVALQPEHHFIYGDLTEQEQLRETYRPRPRDHLDFIRNKKSAKSSENKNEIEMPGGCSLRVIRAVQEMTGATGLGTTASIEDWNTRENAEQETIAMIRRFGLGPSNYLALNKDLTLPTYPIPKRSYVRKNGKILFPIFLDDEFKIESTRMLNAKLAKELQEQTTNSEEEEIRALPCEDEEHIETIAEAKERELKEFIEEYPTLGQHKTISTKSKKNNKNNTKSIFEQENWRAAPSSASSSSSLNTTPKEPDNWRVKNSTNTSSKQKQQTNWRTPNSHNSNLSYSSICNNSNISSNASFISYNSSNSDEYASAKESLDSSTSDQLQEHGKRFSSQIVKQQSSQPEERLSRGKQSSKDQNLLLYTPKEVYDLKKKNQRK